MSIQIVPDYRIKTSRELVETIRKSNGKNYCFILGSGASVESGIRTGNTLGYLWMEDLEKESKFDVIKNLSDSFKKDGKINHEVDQIIAAYEEAKNASRRSMPSEYYFDVYFLRYYHAPDEGKRFLENEMEKATPSIGYLPLALMLANEAYRNNLVITTNFDNLLEEALFTYADKHPIVINHETMADFAKRKGINRPIIAKVHRGLYYAPLNSSTDTNQLKDEWRNVLEILLSKYIPIVIGYGGGDDSLMSLLEEEGIVDEIFWCYRESSGLPSERVQRLIEKNEGRFLVKTDGFDAFMLTIGNEFFREEIDPAKVADKLLRETKERIDEYNKRYSELMKKSKEISDKPVASESEREFTASFDKIDKTVQESEREREEGGNLTPWDYIRKGNRLCDDGKYNEAIEFYSKAIELKPDYAEAYSSCGVAYIKKGDYDQAIAGYSKAIELRPDDAKAYNNRGNAYWYKGEYDQAIAEYSKAIELKPDDAKVYNNRGNAYEYKGEYDQAIAEYSKAIELKPDLAEVYNNRGNAYGYKGEYDQAIAEYSKAIKLKPYYAEAYYNRGHAYSGKGDYDQAIADYSKAIELKPDYAATYNNRASAYWCKGDYDRVIADYSKAIELKPDYASAYNNRGDFYRKKGDYDRVIAGYSKAIELKPDDAAAYNNRGDFYRKKGDYDRAIADYSRVIELKPDDVAAYNNRGNAYRRKGDYDQAMADYIRAIELKPDDAAAYNNRGDIYRRKGSYDQAMADLNKAIELKPDYAEAYSNRGDIYSKKGDYDQAMADLNKAIELKPDLAEAYYNRGDAYSRKGDYDQTLADYKKAAKLRK